MRHTPATKNTYLGRAGENKANCIDFSLPSDWEGATSENVVLKFTRPNTEEPVLYNVVVTGHIAEWIVPESATISGVGRMELSLIEGSSVSPGDYSVLKTLVYNTVCDKSVGGESESPVQSTWHDDIVKLIMMLRQGILVRSEDVTELPSEEQAEVGVIYVVNNISAWLFDRDRHFVSFGGGSSTATITFAAARPTTPTADILYAIGTHGNYVLECYHNGEWETFSGSSYPEYTGQTEFTPSTDNEQTGATANHYLASDIKVHKIPRADVDNPAGGRTTTIG